MANDTFLGLHPYMESDSYRFKGRERESMELFRLISRNDTTVCYAESGEGKTSLLNAGVFPLLRGNLFFPITITFTSDDYKLSPTDFNEIIDRCIKDCLSDYNRNNPRTRVEYCLNDKSVGELALHDGLLEILNRYSWWRLRNYKPQAMGLAFTPVFVFDQFEEVFSLPESVAWTNAFFGWLEEVLTDNCPDEIVQAVRDSIGPQSTFPLIKTEKDFKTVFSLRKEFIGELDYWCMQRFFIPDMKDNRYCLKALTFSGARDVMTQQGEFDEKIVDRILSNFMERYTCDSEHCISEDLPAIPALLLSVVCDSWEQDPHAFDDVAKDEIDKSLGRVLEQFYDRVLGASRRELLEPDVEKQCVRTYDDIDVALFSLIDSNGKRVRVKTTSPILDQIDFDAKCKKVLSDNRLIKVTKVDGEDYVELVHDSLCPIVAQRKEEWVAMVAQEREEKLVKERMKRIRKRMMTIFLLCVGFLSIAALFVWQNGKFHLAERKLALSNEQNDSIRRTNDYITNLNDSISQLNTSLALQMETIERQRDSLNISLSSLQLQMEKNMMQEKAIEAKNQSIKLNTIFDVSDFKGTFDNRLAILRWLDSYRNACMQKDIDFIGLVLDDNVMVVIKQNDNLVLWDKKEYLGELTNAFENKRIDYDDVSISKSVGGGSAPLYSVDLIETVSSHSQTVEVNKVKFAVEMTGGGSFSILRIIKHPFSY